MPATSARQFRAMQAAAHGRSTLGIPATVGREFVAATPHPKELPVSHNTKGTSGIHIKPSRKGKLHRALGVPQGQPISAAKEAKARKGAGSALKKEIVFAQNAKGWHHPSISRAMGGE